MATNINDASNTNESERSSQIFKDISLSFEKHPITGDIAKLNDIDAVKRSVRNLVNTNFGERPFHPEIGSDVRATLFEPVSVTISNIISRQVEDVINNFEPRCELVNVLCDADIDNNGYDVTIEFYVRNTASELQTINSFLESLR